jgi:hypothetical protein
MRPFGTLIDKTIKFREPSIPGARLERVQPPAINRLDEGIKELFDNACLSNDLDAAADLIALAEKWHARRPYSDEHHKQVGGVHVKRMHGELERRHIMHAARHAISGGRAEADRA